MRIEMPDDDLQPYRFARERFAHAYRELREPDRDSTDRLLASIIALSPLRAEDMPRSCQVLYEQLQKLVGASLWSRQVSPGALPAAIRALSLQRRAAAMELIVMAGRTLDKYCGVRPASRTSGHNVFL